MTNYPTIGIRPIIDGRRFGVRESLEEKTMQMAKMAKELIESEIRYPDGTPMKCVISDCTIGGGLRPAVRHAECVRHPERYSLLVLRQRDDGPGSFHH